MNYHNITKDDMLNGDGLRVVLWVSGCSHKCNGCQNPETWDYKSGIPFDELAKQELFEQMDKSYISGITFSGGDPLNFHNAVEVFQLCVEIKEKFPSKTIWLYTGYQFEEIADMFLDAIDVLVEGRFEKDKEDINYPWAGSTNQRVINLKNLRKLEPKCEENDTYTKMMKRFIRNRNKRKEDVLMNCNYKSI